MAVTGPVSARFSFAGHDITSQVRSFSGYKRNDQVVESTPFGTAAAVQKHTGKYSYDDMTLSLELDDTATTGSGRVFGIGTIPTVATVAQAFVVTHDSGDTASFPCLVVENSNTLDPGDLNMKTVTLRPTGEAMFVGQV